MENAMTGQQWFESLSLEEKIGQVMIIGFDGTTLTPELKAMITEYHVGGVILFARNVESPEQVARLCNDLQQAATESGHPGLLIAIDQEGGRVARLTEAKGFTEFPGAMAIGATGSPDNARQVTAAMAAEMRAVGINVDFAPDLDVNNNPQNPVIGVRSYGSEPQQVAAFGTAAIEGLQAGGVLAFGKHFPGHGDTGTDSHVALPQVAHPLERLETVEFVPFEAAIRANVAGIMSAHVTFPAIDATPGTPATVSSKVLTDLLRQEMQFTGLVVTDSLEMGALGEAGYPVPQAAAAALKAGADLLLFNRDHALHRQAIDEVEAQIQNGTIPMERLDAAVQRVLAVKEQYGLLSPTPAAIDQIDNYVYTQGNIELSRQIAAQSITLLRDEAGLLPLKTDAPLLVVEVPAAAGLGNLLGATSIAVSNEPTAAEIQLVLGTARDGRTVIVTTSDANRTPAQVALINALLEAGVPTVIIAVRNPYDLMAFPEATTYLLSYGNNPPALEALVKVLRGEILPQGKLPIEIPGLYPIGAGMDGFADRP
jgi:beta-N-acetylhexosaminidase